MKVGFTDGEFMDQRRGGNTSGKARKDDGHKLTSQQVRILPDPIDPESLGDKSRAIGKSVRAISGNRRDSRRDGNFV